MGTGSSLLAGRAEPEESPALPVRSRETWAPGAGTRRAGISRSRLSNRHIYVQRAGARRVRLYHDVEHCPLKTPRALSIPARHMLLCERPRVHVLATPLR